jgi:phosphatidylglycerophosphatase C
MRRSADTLVVAAFDLDGTLTAAAASFPGCATSPGSPAVFRAALRLAGAADRRRDAQRPWADRAKERLFLDLLSRPRPRRGVATSRGASPRVTSNTRRATPVLARLNWHRQQGHDVVIVSASPQLYVDVVAEALERRAPSGRAWPSTRLGRLTGGYLGKNCRGTEKMRRLASGSTSATTASPGIYAYGNSRGDRRMLESGATYPFNVGVSGPFGALRRYPRLPQPADYCCWIDGAQFDDAALAAVVGHLNRGACSLPRDHRVAVGSTMPTFTS